MRIGKAIEPLLDHAFGFSIPGLPEHVAKARGELAGFLAAAGVPAELVEDAALAGSELVTNAVMHSASGLVGGQVAVYAVVHRYGWVQVDVSDQGPIPPGLQHTPHQVSRGGEGGLGKTVVAGLSEQIGDYTDQDGRHVVWFRLTWNPAASAGEGVVRRHG